MGHTEMLLAVAGLDRDRITERVRYLASGEWSHFTPAEQVAFAFACKLARNPARLSDDDFRQLADHLGPERALDVVWWCCRCQYMTHVANAFQLPLEQENVFDGFRPSKEALRRP